MKIKQLLQTRRSETPLHTKNLRKIACVSHEKYAKNVGFVFVKERRIVMLS